MNGSDFCQGFHVKWSHLENLHSMKTASWAFDRYRYWFIIMLEFLCSVDKKLRTKFQNFYGRVIAYVIINQSQSKVAFCEWKFLAFGSYCCSHDWFLYSNRMANPHRNLNPHSNCTVDNLIDSQIWIFLEQIRRNLKFKLWALMHLNLCSSLPCHPSYDGQKYLSQKEKKIKKILNLIELKSKAKNSSDDDKMLE